MKKLLSPQQFLREYGYFLIVPRNDELTWIQSAVERRKIYPLWLKSPKNLIFHSLI
jgi:uncharacterized protein YqgQ